MLKFDEEKEKIAGSPRKLIRPTLTSSDFLAGGLVAIQWYVLEGVIFEVRPRLKKTNL